MKTLGILLLALTVIPTFSFAEEEDYTCAAASTAERYAYFERVYYSILDNANANDLEPEQLVQHFLNRLSGGAHPYRLNPSSLYTRDNVPEVSTAAIKIACNIVTQIYSSGSSYARVATGGTPKFEPAENVHNLVLSPKLPHLANFRVSAIQTNQGLLNLYRQAHRTDHAPAINYWVRMAMGFEQINYYALDNYNLRWSLQDFWFNHFNVDSGKVTLDVPEYRRFIFEKQFGKFGDMLASVIKHPAMLIYLDNHTSTKVIAATATKPARGPHENLARELMELHTLGTGPTSGVYTQADVAAAAKILTGWGVGSHKVYTVARPFLFYGSLHDASNKRVMGKTYPGDVRTTSEGDELLRDLALHPSTAENIATKLAIRFVSENPDQTRFLRGRLKNIFLNTDGNLREVYKELFASDEFWSNEARESKAKRPLEFVASVLRHTGVSKYTLNTALVAEAFKTTTRMGQELTRCPVPTGYPDEIEHWVHMNNTVEGIRFSVLFSGQNPCQKVGAEYRCIDNNPDYNDAIGAHYQSYLAREADAVANNLSAMNLVQTVFAHWYKFHPLTVRYRLSPGMADVNTAFNQPVATPDLVGPPGSRKKMPIQAMAGFFMGSKEFWKR